MDSDALWLDGNAVAGLLLEVFEADVTATVRTCSSCNRDHAIGAHRAYRGAGVVLRCPSCGAVAVRIALSPEPRAT
jgi:predicted RNA-binding Zn-ribbon protein involved in translation (DUF1610 family)